MRELNKELRPKTFEEVVGQTSTKILLQNAIEQNRLPRLILFSGPSGTGKSTLAEIAASQIADQSQIRKVNMGAMQGKGDILEVIKEVFVLQAGSGNNVFILEEVHSLTKEQQIPFLEEVERQQERVFVFMCTTEPMRLIPELRGRATTFRLDRPSKEECTYLVERACDKLNIKAPSKTAIKWLIRRVGTVPRELIKTIDILSVGFDLTEESISRYLGSVSTDKFIAIMEAAKEESLYNFYEQITSDEYSAVDLVTGLKEFYKDLMEYLYGQNKQIFSIPEKKRIQALMQDVRQEDLLRTVQFVGKIDATNDTDAFYQLIEFRRYIHGATKATELKDSKRQAVKSEIRSEEATRTNIQTTVREEEELSLEAIQRITGDQSVYK